MATPATAASDATNPEAAEVPSAAPASESEGPFDSGVVAAATTPAVVDSAVEGDAPAAPAPTSGSGPAAPSMPANPASPATPGPPRPQFAGSPAYASPPAPAFSYNVLPRPSPRPQVGSGAAQQQLASPPVGYRAPSMLHIAIILYSIPFCFHLNCTKCRFIFFLGNEKQCYIALLGPICGVQLRL
jgi:transcription elongation regulator 1